jgi:hypothetical protein
MATQKVSEPLFRWAGQYWGFLAGDGVYDRHGRHVGRIQGNDVYDRDGKFMGELMNRYYVLRNVLRPEPIHLAPEPAVPFPTPPASLPDRQARVALDGWTDALPWPLPPPQPLKI